MPTTSPAESIDSGKPIREARGDIAGVVDILEYFAGAATKVAGQTMDRPMRSSPWCCASRSASSARSHRGTSPVAVWKVAAALCVGCTVVLKPSELASLTCLHFGELMGEAGLPPGVLNVVSGEGGAAGAALARHRDVDMLTFTGSTATGAAVMRARAERTVPLQVELGGKSPLVVFSDVDLDRAVDAAAFGAFFAQGENCNAGSRIIVERSIAAEFISRLCAVAARIRVGDPPDQATEFGALISRAQFDKVAGFVERARAAGVVVAAGGHRALVDGCTDGCFSAPTVLTGVVPSHEVFAEEIFGPVVTVTEFDTEEEAVRLANASDYGLAAGVWTATSSGRCVDASDPFRLRLDQHVQHDAGRSAIRGRQTVGLPRHRNAGIGEPRVEDRGDRHHAVRGLVRRRIAGHRSRCATTGSIVNDWSAAPKDRLSEVVAGQIRDAIRRGVLRPGDRLIEADLAHRLDVSKTPVREAVRDLERQGLVQMHLRRGSFVRRMTVQDLREIRTLRATLEGLALRLGMEVVDPEPWIAELEEPHRADAPDLVASGDQRPARRLPHRSVVTVEQCPPR